MWAIACCAGSVAHDLPAPHRGDEADRFPHHLVRAGGEALADPARFLAYAMRYATHEDMKVIRAHASDEEFRRFDKKAASGD